MNAPDVLTFGETMAAVRASGPLALGGPARITTAGAESTVAIGLARLGHGVAWAGLVGDDELGRLVLRTLRAEGVDIAAARTVQGPTGLAVFEPRVADLVRVTYYRHGSAGSRLTPAHVPDALVDRARIVHVTGITAALGSGPRATVEHAVRRGVTVSLDVNHRDRLWTRAEAAAVLRPLLPHVTVLIASDDELDIVGAGPTELLAAGVREVVVKRGAAGAELVTAAGSTERAAVPVPVRDVVGAGDAFVAGYLSGLLDDLPAGGRLDRAVALGAFAVASDGDWEGLPRRDELALLAAAPGSAVR